MTYHVCDTPRECPTCRALTTCENGQKWVKYVRVVEAARPFAVSSFETFIAGDGDPGIRPRSADELKEALAALDGVGEGI